MRKFCILTFFFLLQVSVVYARVEGKVSGKVVNFTSDTPVSSQEVTLKAWQKNSPVFEKKMITDESGNFEFSEFEIGEGLIYDVSTNYSDVDYSSRQFILTKDKSEITLTVKVYEVSEDLSNISIPVYHIVLRETEDAFEVFETFSVMNTGKTSFPKLLLELPKDYQNLEFMQGFMECCVKVSENRIVHNMALKPGGGTFSLRFRLRQSESLDLSRVLPFDVKRLLVITELDNISLSSPGFSQRSVEKIEGRNFYTFSMDDEVKHDEQMELILKTGIKPQNNLLWGIVSLVFVSAFVFFFAIFLKRRSRSSMAERLSTFSQHEQILLSFISKLDEMRKAGDLSDDIYEEFRSEQEDKLRKIQGWLSKNKEQEEKLAKGQGG